MCEEEKEGKNMGEKDAVTVTSGNKTIMYTCVYTRTLEYIIIVEILILLLSSNVHTDLGQ